MNDTSDGAQERRLRAQALLARRVDGDRLMLADPVLTAALDGRRPLTPKERAALQGSPLTLRRLRQLALDRRAAGAASWRGSVGMLRAASGAAPLQVLVTDDGYWRLHFVAADRAWHVILALAGEAPFAARLLRENAVLRVLDGDGEYEDAWPFAAAPAPHFQQCGARFAVEPVSQ